MNLANIELIIAHKNKKIVKHFEKTFYGLINVDIIRCPLLQISKADCVVCLGDSYGKVDEKSNSIVLIIKNLQEKINYVINNIYYGEQPVGTAIIPNPIMTIRDVKIFPPTVIGKASPYPTVVNVTIDHHSASKIDPNCSG